MKNVGINMSDVKRQNRSTVLKCIMDKGPISRKDIAELTGLTPASVTIICNELIDQGLVYETGETQGSGGAGRKKILVDLNHDYCRILSITIEPEKTSMVIVDMKGEAVARKEILTNRDIAPIEFLQELANECKVLLNSHPKEAKLIAGGCVGITGIVDKINGTSIHAYGIWDVEVPVTSILENELSISFMIENNVNAFAVAELLFGKGKEEDNLLVIKWGPGVGSTIIINDQIYEGKHGKAAEIGHFIIEKHGDLCSCGRFGCLETKISYKALRKKIDFTPESLGEVYLKEKRLGKSGHIEEAIDLFARTIVNTVTILAPNGIVLFGKMFSDKVIRDRLIENCKEYDLSFDEKKITYTKLADKEDYLGPVAVYIQQMLY